MTAVLNVIFAGGFYKQNKHMTNSSYLEVIQKQRQEREKHLVANPRNWFSLAGLFPLLEGQNILGGDSPKSITIPGIPPAFYATLELDNQQVTIKEFSNELLINGCSANNCRLNTDHDENTDVLSIGTIQMIIIQRGEQFFIRAWDTQSEKAKGFTGLNYYPIDPAWRIEAQFKPFMEPRILPVEDVIGTKYEVKFTGHAFFTITGIPCSLIAEKDEDNLLFSFSDLTKIDTTYPAGRYLLAEMPADNRVTLDFNLARNWPCAYTSFATCPLPPFENHLRVRIEAGEKRYQ